MSKLVPAPVDKLHGALHAELRALIASSRQRLAGAVNAELTRLYWSVGERLRTEVLGGADRAKYGDQLINRVGEQLAQEFGRGFEAKNLRRMVQFAQTFPQTEIVATLSRQLTWSHVTMLIPLTEPGRRDFYHDCRKGNVIVPLRAPGLQILQCQGAGRAGTPGRRFRHWPCSCCRREGPRP